MKNHGILRQLKNRKEVMILKPDKGSGVVIMHRKVYSEQCLKIIDDKSTFKPLIRDPTLYREVKLQKLLRSLKSKGCLTDETYRIIYPKGSQPARFYGLPKIHKMNDKSQPPKLRPIVSSIGAYNYQLAKYLSSLLTPHIPDKFTTRDSFTFVKELQAINLNNKFLISLDIQSLFSNIPLKETINLAVDTILKHNANFPIKKIDLAKLFSIATSETHFLFQGNIYDQIDGVSMGSPLAPVLANLFMGFNEDLWLKDYKNSKVRFYKRYVDDTFCLFDNEADAMLFYEYINSRHPNIKFTFEKQSNK